MALLSGSLEGGYLAVIWGDVANRQDFSDRPTLRQAEDDAAATHALDVMKQLRAINGVSMEILTAARKSKDPDTALKAVDRIQRQIELQAKLLGALDDRPHVNTTVLASRRARMRRWCARRARQSVLMPS